MAEQALTPDRATWEETEDRTGAKTGRRFLIETPTKYTRAAFRRRLATAGVVEVSPEDLQFHLVRGVETLLADAADADARETALGALAAHRLLLDQLYLLYDRAPEIEQRAKEIGEAAVAAAIDQAHKEAEGLDVDAALLQWQRAAYAGELGGFRLALAETARRLVEAARERERLTRAVRRGYPAYAEAVADAEHFDEMFALEAVRAFVGGWEGEGLPPYRRGLDGLVPAEVIEDLPDFDVEFVGALVRGRLQLAAATVKKSVSPSIGRSSPASSTASEPAPKTTATDGGSAAASAATLSPAG